MLKKHKRLLVIALAGLALLAVVIYLVGDDLVRQFRAPTDSSVEDGVRSAGGDKDVETVLQDRPVPWEITWLPGGDMLVTERPGTLRRVGHDNQTYSIEGVVQTSEGGLLGLALHPDFKNNGWLYLYMTARDGDRLINRVERYRYAYDRLTDRRGIITGIPGASNHDGGRIAFGPDGYLYITTGDAGNESSAQDRAALSGKILRVDDAGRVPDNNPYGNAVYSYGHRNPQGLAWDARGRLWSTEHGRSGVNSGYDELNLIVRGGNYGWPEVQGDESRPGMTVPVAHSGPDETWAPGGLAYYDGSLFFGGLRGQSLYEASLRDDGSVSMRAHFRTQYGRLRTTAVHDGRLYVTTSNTDGRGEARQGDDRILNIRPGLLGH